MRILQQLKHPHIVPLLGAFPSHITSGRPEYVLVFPERETTLHRFLSRRVGEENDLPVIVIKQFAKQMASALEHMHGQGIMHRDLKPANILMKWDSLGSTVGLAVEVADFGHARFVKPASRRRITDKQVVDEGRHDMRRSMVGLTPGVCTYVYILDRSCGAVGSRQT